MLTETLHYDGAPRPITADEADKIARDEWSISSAYGQHHVLSRGGDGGMHIRQTFGRSQAALAWMIPRRNDLIARIMAGKCQHTIFYDRARDAFYCG